MGLLEDVAAKYGKDSNWNALRGRTDDPLLTQLSSQYGTFAAGGDGLPNWNALRTMVNTSARPKAAAPVASGYSQSTPAWLPPPPPRPPEATQASTNTSGPAPAPAAAATPGAGVIDPGPVGGGGGSTGAGGPTTNNIATSLTTMAHTTPMPQQVPAEASGSLRPGLGTRLLPQYGTALAELLRARSYTAS